MRKQVTRGQPTGRRSMRGQAAITDALIFMIIASSAASLLLYTSSLYGSSTTRQLFFAYSSEFTQHALVTLHYLDDANGDRFWLEVKNRLGKRDPLKAGGELENYLLDEGNYAAILQKLCDSAGVSCDRDEPGLALCFNHQSAGSRCYPSELAAGGSIYASSVKMDVTTGVNTGEWEVTLKVAR